MQQQPHNIRIEELFTPENNASLSYFYASNKIISNPELILQFFTDFADYSYIIQENTLNQLINLMQTLSLNAYTLNSIKTTTSEQISNSPAIIELIIDLLPNYVSNFTIFSKLIKVLSYLLAVSQLDQKIINKVFQKLTLEFHNILGQKVPKNKIIDRKYLFTATQVIKAFLTAKLNLEKQPLKMMMFNGGRYLEISNPKKDNLWIFGQGLSIYFWINIQNIRYGSEAPLPKLFTLYSPNHGGLQCYLIDNKVYYRSLGSKYSQPQIGSNGLLLGELQPKKWIFFGLQHQPPKKLLGRSQINFYLNDKKNTFHLSPPSISSKQKMKIMFFDRIYCRASSICIVPKYGEPNMLQILSKNKNSIDSLKNHKFYIFEERQGYLYQRRGQLGFSHDKILSRDRTMNFKQILPLFRILTYTNTSEDSLLNDILYLFVLYLLQSHDNQIIAEKKNYPHMIAELIKQLANLYQQFNTETVNTLLHIKQSITNPQLLSQYYGDLLWVLVDSNIKISHKQQILQIINSSFTQNIAYFSQMIGLDQMINLIFKLQKKSVRCCEKHFKILSQRFPKKQKIMEFESGFGQAQGALKYILNMIELYLQNQKFGNQIQLYKLCKLLSFTNKFSPCFTNSLLGLLRKVLTQKLTQKLNSNQSKKVFEYLNSKKVYLLFLYVIENSFFAEIKAESVRIIYNILFKKSDQNQRNQISHRVSKVLWKINQQNHYQDNNQRDNSGKMGSEDIDKIPSKGEQQFVQEMAYQKQRENLQNVNKIQAKLELNKKYESMSAQQEYKQVGPQAPKLSNRLKGNKNFNFNFMSQSGNNESQSSSKGLQLNLKKKKRRNSDDTFSHTLTGVNPSSEGLQQTGSSFDTNKEQIKETKLKKKHSKLLFREDSHEFNDDDGQIMEEQKTNQNQLTMEQFKQYDHKIEDSEKEPSPEEKQTKKVIKIRKPFNINLNIDTEAINQMYTFGGQKGQQIVISQQQQAEQLNKIRKLAKKCLAKMKGIQLIQEQQLQNKAISQKVMIPPPTTSNRILKMREKKSQKKILQKLNLISQQEDEHNQQSDKKSPHRINNYPLSSPNYTKKTKSPSSIIKIAQQNMITLYNSLMECCIGNANFQIQIPSILSVFFIWIPQTNLEAKFIMDLLLILQNDEDKKMNKIINIPELYDFLLQLTYKGLLFQEMDEQLMFMKRLEDLIQKVYAYIFKKDPQFNEKIEFIFDWARAKSPEYHPRCLFFTTRYLMHLIMGSVEESLFTSRFDKITQSNFQHLGASLSKFCKFLPIQEDQTIFIDQFQRIIMTQDFKVIPSIVPCFTSQWADYIMCERYLLLFKKFLCTDWYSKSLKNFKNLKTSNQSGIVNLVYSVLSSLQIQAQAQFYLKNSFIFELVELSRYIFIEKTLSTDIRLSSSVQDNEAAQLIWQTIFIIILADFNKQKSQRYNAEFVSHFLKSCKVLKDLQASQGTIIILFLLKIKQYYKNQSPTINMTGSGLFLETNKQKIVHNPAKTISAPFVQSLIENYINERLFKPYQDLEELHFDFQAFKLNFQEIEYPQKQILPKQVPKQLYKNFINYNKKIDKMADDFIQEFTNVLQEQNQRFHATQILIEAANRQARSDFRKIWKNLRIYGGSWTHPEIKFQNDVLFNKNLFTYEKYDANQFYKWKIAKHTSKYRLRYLLKPNLYQPIQEQNLIKEQIYHEKSQIGLNRAITHLANNKLLMGRRVLDWLFGKNFESMEIILPFKKVRLIKTLTIRHGFIAIINDKLLFISQYHKQPESHLAISEYKIRRDKTYYKVWPIQFVKQIFKRRYVNRKRALQITFIHGKSILLEFYENQLEQFLKKILKLKGNKCPNLIYNGHKSLDPRKMYDSEGLNKKWNTFEITNFQYIMQLNNLAGRCYADLTQYPVMPWVLINFDSKLVMGENQNYRDLSLPLGALGSQSRTEAFRERYQNMGEVQEEKFHYGTHYSSPGIIYHFLVRLSPFTEGSILLQSGKFDFADRLFFSIGDSYKNATSQFSDVRQLLPELYTIPEAYLNINKLDLGIMQNQKRVHNVDLPVWARDNPYLYVTKLRKAFEQAHVSKSINKWIDLIFGYKQRGQQAEKNLNCFVYLTYEDSIDFQSIQQKKTITAIQTQVLNFGQTPSQIFSKPHHERSPISSIPHYGMICDEGVEPRIYRPTRYNNSDLLKDEKIQNALEQSDGSIIHMKWFKDSKLVFIRKNGQMMWYKWHTSQTGTNKAPFQCAIQKQKNVTLITKKVLLESFDLTFDPSLVCQSFPMEFFNNGHHIALGGLIDGKMLIIDADNNTLIQICCLHQHTVSSIVADSKNNFLISGDISGKVIIWRINTANKLVIHNEMKDHTRKINDIFISYDLRFFLTAGDDGAAFSYNIITGKKMKCYYHPKKLPINHIIVSTNPLPVVILFSNQQSMIYCYSINGQLIQRVHEKIIDYFLSPILMKDSNGLEHIAYGNEKGRVIFRALPFLDNSSKHIVARDALVNRICISKSGKFIIAGCSDGELSVITSPETNK